METKSNNPLHKYFRQPVIYLKLPSEGQFYPAESLEMPISKELPVYPLTSRDEITLRTPDALINGSSVVEIIQSCIPNIKNAWQVLNVDLDAIFIAIRIASYGHNMELSVTCPDCKEAQNYQIDLRNSLAKIQSPNYTALHNVGPLKVKMKPQSYQTINKINNLRFEEVKISEQLNKSNYNELDQLNFIKEQMRKVNDLNLEGLADGTEYIQTPDNEIVNNKDFILDFYKNADAATISGIENLYQAISKDGGSKVETFTCGKCQKEFQSGIEFDYSNFFVKGS